MSSSRVSVLAFALSVFCGPGTAQIFVTDQGNNSVLEYDTTGAFVSTFVSPGSGGLNVPRGLVFGPDGNLYIASYGPPAAVLRYNGQTGAFMGTFVAGGSGGAIVFTEITFGPNGNLFATDFSASNIKEYDGTTGAFITVFATTSISSNPLSLAFGPDGNLYVADETDVEEFNGITGAFIKSFPPGSDLAASIPSHLAFGPDGSLYVGTGGPCCPEVSGEILKYNPATGALLGVFVPPGSGGLEAVGPMIFRPDGFLYVLSTNTVPINSTKEILRYNATNGAFVNAFLVPPTGGLVEAAYFTFAPPAGPRYHVCLLYDPTKAVNGGSTIPVKLQLCDASGNDLSSSSITLHATSVTQVSTSISGVVQDSGNANPDTDFRFDSTLGSTGGYIFNLSTKGLTTGTYNLNFTVTGDSFVYAAPFQVK